MSRRRYTNDQKMAAVAEAEVNGVTRASETTGIPATTIDYWLDKPEFVELRAKTREEMRDGFKVLVHKVQEKLTNSVDSMEPRDLTILLGVATDKTLLLSGDATSRNETVTPSLPSEVQRALRERYSDLARDHAVGQESVVEMGSEGSPAATEG